MNSNNTKQTAKRLLGLSLLALSAGAASAQGNSPYSRYGLGDMSPGTHIINRGMAGVSAADADWIDPTGTYNRNFYSHINFNNPASYSSFLAPPQRTSTRNGTRTQSGYGRVLLDVGVNIDNRTLRQAGATDKFSSSEINISYIQVGIPIRKGWGLVFGIRPINRIGYQIESTERIAGVDSVYNNFEGSGGAYLPSIGTGVRIGGLSLGTNIGYLFGNRETNNTRIFENDSVIYFQGLYRTQTFYSNVFLNFGAQYEINLGKESDKQRIAQKKPARNQFLRLGVTGNFRRKLKARQDVTKGTFVSDPNANLTDSVYTAKDLEGSVIYPASFTAGLMFGANNSNNGFWQAGLDVVHTSWDQYRFYGQKDAVQSNTIVRVGAQFLPNPQPGSTLLARVIYRAGLALGNDYITASGRMPYWNATAGLGVPLGHRNSQAKNQQTMINMAFEYQNRGNNSNLLKENNFRFSIGLNLSDVWFQKRKYD